MGGGGGRVISRILYVLRIVHALHVFAWHSNNSSLDDMIRGSHYMLFKSLRLCPLLSNLTSVRRL